MSEGPQILKIIRTTPVFVTHQTEAMIFPLWRGGKDTLDIAQALGLPEYEIANRLWKLRQERVN